MTTSQHHRSQSGHIYNAKLQQQWPSSTFSKLPFSSQKHPCVTQGCCCADAGISLVMQQEMDAPSLIRVGVIVAELLEYFKIIIFHPNIAHGWSLTSNLDYTLKVSEHMQHSARCDRNAESVGIYVANSFMKLGIVQHLQLWRSWDPGSGINFRI